MSAERVTYYWCVPAQDDEARLQTVIDDLAKAQGAPCFMPHMSLASVQGSAPDLASVLSDLRGLQLRPIEIDETDDFTMSLFLRVEPSPELIRARQVFEGIEGFRSSRLFDPHLSLCYGPPPDGAADLENVRALLKKPIKFDRLVTVDIPSRVSTYDDIRAWNILETIPF